MCVCVCECMRVRECIRVCERACVCVTLCLKSCGGDQAVPYERLAAQQWDYIILHFVDFALNLAIMLSSNI